MSNRKSTFYIKINLRPKPVEYEFLDAEQWKDTDAAYESIDAIPGTLQDKHKRRAATVISDGTLLVEKQFVHFVDFICDNTLLHCFIRNWWKLSF